jgi:hypothetical protein
MNKHTPGPWHLFERNRLCIESPTGNVALCNLARNSEADAKLIAAAPELLEALVALREAVRNEPTMNAMRYDSLGAQVNEAINKATR